MTESKKFEMQLDDETPEFQVQEDLDDLKVEKLHKRITRISIIIPCLVVIIILAAYFDLKKNLSRLLLFLTAVSLIERKCWSRNV